MHCAPENGYIDAIMALKGAGADVSARNINQSTPMHCAAENGHVDAINASTAICIGLLTFILLYYVIDRDVTSKVKLIVL